MENWLPVIGYEGRYEVSDFGNVRSWINRRGEKRKEAVLMSPALVVGYQRLALVDSLGIRKNLLVHRLVVAAFLGKSSLEVNHLNGKRNDPRLVNLEYTNRSGNMVHAYKLGLQRPRVGEKNEQHKLKNSDVHFIRQEVKRGATQKSMADQFGVDQSYISRIVNHKKRKEEHCAIGV